MNLHGRLTRVPSLSIHFIMMESDKQVRETVHQIHDQHPQHGRDGLRTKKTCFGVDPTESLLDSIGHSVECRVELCEEKG